MADLVEATGLHKGSLYKAFESKHELFMKCLARYLEEADHKMRAALTGAESPLDGLRAWLQGVVLLCRSQPLHRGCLAMNTAVELGPHDSEVTDLLRRHHARTSRMLTETIESGQRAGQLRSDLSADRLAQALFVFGAGLLGATKVLADTIDAEEMVESALSMVVNSR